MRLILNPKTGTAYAVLSRDESRVLMSPIVCATVKDTLKSAIYTKLRKHMRRRNLTSAQIFVSNRYGGHQIDEIEDCHGD